MAGDRGRAAVRWADDVQDADFVDGDLLRWDAALGIFIAISPGDLAAVESAHVPYAAGNPVGGDDKLLQIRTDEAVPPRAAAPNFGIWQNEGGAWVRVAARLKHGDNHYTGGSDPIQPADIGAAPIASPLFTGDPQAPTPVIDDNDQSLATTHWVIGQGGAATPLMDGTAAAGSSLRWAHADHIHPTDTSRAPLASPAFTGTPTAPTAAVDTNTTQVATAAFVLAQAAAATPLMDGVAAVGISTRYARADHIHPVDTSRMSATVAWGGDLGGTGASPTVKQATPTLDLLTGQPAVAFKGDIDTAKWIAKLGGFALTFSSDSGDATDLGTGQTTYAGRTYKPKVSFGAGGEVNAKTAAVDTNTTQLATTAFVLAQASAVTPNMDGTGAVGTSTRYARADHTHPTDTSRAPLASPTFTGTPAAPTAAVDTNTTQLATTAFVLAQAASTTPNANGAAAVGTSTRYARADHVHPFIATVTSLPGSPYDGQEIFYVADATNGVVWHLKYRAASGSAYKWEFIGGAQLGAEVDTSEACNSTSYTALATVGPSVTVPLAGDYVVEIGANVLGLSPASIVDCMMSFDVGATGAVDADRAELAAPASVTFYSSIMRARLKTGLSASTALVSKYKGSATASIIFYRLRWMAVRPRRVG